MCWASHHLLPVTVRVVNAYQYLNSWWNMMQSRILCVQLINKNPYMKQTKNSYHNDITMYMNLRMLWVIVLN